jgi:8-oxo-dGTP pyrophosphatase MutT (NUDIX family)
MARLVLVKIGVDVIQFDELAFNVYVYAEEVREWGAVSKPSRAPSFDIAAGTWPPLVGDRSRDGGQRAEGWPVAAVGPCHLRLRRQRGASAVELSSRLFGRPLRAEYIYNSPMSPFPRPPLSSLLDLAWRTAFRLGYPLARAWWWLTHPPYEGAVVAVYVGPQLLLIHASYQAGWQLPGGGVRRGEAPEDAARRELAEEIGLAASALIPAGVACGNWDGRRDRVHFFELQLVEPPKLQLDNREIIASRLASPSELHSMVLTGPVTAYLGRRCDVGAG